MLFLLASGLVSASGTCRASASTNRQAALRHEIAFAIVRYERERFGVSGPPPRVGSVEIFCQRTCGAPAHLLLAAYYEGDGGATVMLRRETPRAALTVLTAGGGVLDVATMEKLGLDARDARRVAKANRWP